MHKYRILIYRKGIENPIVLSDISEKNITSFANSVEKIFQSPKICQIKTDSSIYIGRPSQIDGLEIYEENFEKEQSIDEDENDSIVDKEQQIDDTIQPIDIDEDIALIEHLRDGVEKAVEETNINKIEIDSIEKADVEMTVELKSSGDINVSDDC